MSRKSKREVERQLEGLGDESDDGHGMDSWTTILYDVGPKYFDENGEVVPTDDDGDPAIDPDGTLMIFDGEYADPEDTPQEVLEWYDQNEK